MSNAVGNGLSWGVPLWSGPAADTNASGGSGLLINRTVVVAWFRMEGAATPRLRRALSGAGAPGRRARPGRGESPSEERPALRVKWSV